MMTVSDDDEKVDLIQADPDQLADPERPLDVKGTLDQLRRTRLRLRLAMSADTAGKALAEAITIWQDFQSLFHHVREQHTHRPDDPAWTQKLEHCIAADIALQMSFEGVLQALQACRFRAELIERYEVVFAADRLKQSPWLTERTREDSVTERLSASRLWDHYLSARVFCLGQKWSLKQLPDLLSSPQRSIRRAALRGLNDWLQLQDTALDAEFTNLLTVRRQLATKLRLPAGQMLSRPLTDFPAATQENRQKYLQLVQQFLVPMALEVRRLQRRRLSLDQLQDYDVLCLLPGGMPPDKVAISVSHIHQAGPIPKPFDYPKDSTLKSGFLSYAQMILTIHAPSDSERDTELNRLLTLTRWLEWLVWLASADDFGVAVSEGNVQDPALRRNMWLELESRYFPDIHHDQMPALAAGSLAYLTIRDWLMPGSHLADAFSLLSALAFWYRRKGNLLKATDDLASLTQIAGDLTFEELLQKAKLELPWDETQFKQLMFALASDLDL